MIRLAKYIPLVAAITCCFLQLTTRSAFSQEDNKPPAGFTSLFDGKSLSGWFGLEHFDPRKLEAMSEDDRKTKLDANWAQVEKHWTVENGELVNDGKGPYLTTKKHFENYEFWIDYKTVPKADSGIYLKGTPQVQIWDFTEAGGKWNIGADKGSGGLWNNSAGAAGKDPMVLADKKFGQWNRFRVIQVGARTSVWLNGKQVVDHAVMENFWDRKSPLFRKGFIQLQTHGGEIRWRNVFIKEYNAEEANKYLASKNSDGFVSVFNGKDFDGWGGPTANYQIQDGTIMCKPKNGGTIFTKEKYGDFVARVEIKIPEGGNNGLAIRYPGKGDTAYAGMCELQVLHNDSKKYKGKLDDRQYHGSAYGMSAAKRGYLREPGQWNFQEVTVTGSKIKVELNGTVILDTDLSKVTEYMANSPHPGKENKTGHFGFAGHGDPVQFRNVQIKKLD